MPQKITAILVRVKKWGKSSLDLIVILYLGKPSILIPYPFAANNHQELNAQVLDSVGASVMVKENEFKDNNITLKNLLGVKGENNQATFSKENLINEIKKFIWKNS